jgi:hypothetical protein
MFMSSLFTDVGNAVGLANAGLPPDLGCVTALSKMLQPVREAPLFGGERCRRKWRGFPKHVDRSCAEILDPVRDVAVCATQKGTLRPPVILQTNPRSVESNSSTPLFVSMTSGPLTPIRACWETMKRLHMP